MTFLDSNIFVYSVDIRDSKKQRMAKSIVMDALKSADFIISTQVLNEFAHVSLRKLGKHSDEVKSFLELLRPIRTVQIAPEWTSLAIDIMEDYGIQFYDSLILAAAEANGCDEILTEDLNDGQTYCGVRAVNPFK